MKLVASMLLFITLTGCAYKAWREEYSKKCVDAVMVGNRNEVVQYCCLKNPALSADEMLDCSLRVLTQKETEYSGELNLPKNYIDTHRGAERKEGLSFMCRDAIARQDVGAIDVFCQDMDFMLRESIKQNNLGGIDVFGGNTSFMCRQAIKNQDRGGIFIFCQ